MKGFPELEIIGRAPIYKQITEHIETSIIKGHLKGGSALPSMNDMARMLDISPETVKKAYGILVRRGLLESHQGKGFFVRTQVRNRKTKVVILMDNLSPYKQLFINAFMKTAGKSTETHILIHNKDIDLFRYYIDQSLGKYDYYITAPHFTRDEKTLQMLIRQLERIPKRQLIIADRFIDSFQGDFGAVYQDFENGITEALGLLLKDLRAYPRLEMFTLADCLYGDIVELAVARFCDRNNYHASFHHELSPKYIHKNQVCFFYHHIDHIMLPLDEIAQAKGLVIGKDIKVISYNDTPVCKLLWGGVTTISADFEQMGRLCAEMVKSGDLKQIRCDFKVARRYTF